MTNNATTPSERSPVYEILRECSLPVYIEYIANWPLYDSPNPESQNNWDHFGKRLFEDLEEVARIALSDFERSTI